MEIHVDICPGGDPEAKRLEYDVYLHEGYIEANDQCEVIENADYPEFVHFVARVADRVIGSLRLVVDSRPRHGVFKLASFTHFPLENWALETLGRTESEKVVEVGTMVIHPDFRGGEAYMQLFRKAFEFAVLKRFRYAVSTIDAGFFHRLLTRGLPFSAMGESMYYMGSETVPAIIDIDQLVRMYLGAHPTVVRPAGVAPLPMEQAEMAS